MTFESHEIRAAYDALVETRDRAEAGEGGWDQLADHFTEDATFIDPAWGRVTGRDAIRHFMLDSMTGLEGWTFPREFTAVDGDQLVSGWQNRLPGRRADGSHYQALGISHLVYVGDGLFCYEQDVLNMVHVFELIRESGWKPGPGAKPPPRAPLR
jgi:ketosteroid isomerase-like protein